MFDMGIDALVEEQRIRKEYREFAYDGPDVLRGGGKTEMFTQDVLGLDGRPN